MYYDASGSYYQKTKGAIYNEILNRPSNTVFWPVISEQGWVYETSYSRIKVPLDSRLLKLDQVDVSNEIFAALETQTDVAAAYLHEAIYKFFREVSNHEISNSASEGNKSNNRYILRIRAVS